MMWIVERIPYEECVTNSNFGKDRILKRLFKSVFRYNGTFSLFTYKMFGIPVTIHSDQRFFLYLRHNF